MNIDVITLFPQMFLAPMGDSILGRARNKGILELKLHNLRDFSEDKHKRVDDYPYGGGAGMVLQAPPIFNALEAIAEENSRIIYMSPKGKTFHQEMAISLSKEKHLIFLCGHYEGIDQRVLDYWEAEEISIGDYVLTGGEIPAMVVIDSVARMLPGVLSQEECFKEESFYEGLLEYPQYTRPSDFRGMPVPEILLSGNHKKIDEWRKVEAFKLTIKNRPDLMIRYLDDKKISEKDRTLIQKLQEEELSK